MKYIIPFLALLTFSCGNPHISSSGDGKDNLERTNPPAVENECSSDTIEIFDHNFYFSKSGEGDSPEFLEYIKCRARIRETFTRLNDGTTTSIDNTGREDITYVITHQTEMAHDPDKVEVIEDIFNSTLEEMTIETPVATNGGTGSDRGVDSGDADPNFTDGLLFSMSSPITFWSAKVVGLRSVNGSRALLRLFDCSRELIRSKEIVYPDGNGVGEVHTISFISARADICHVSISAGGDTDSIAVDEFSYGL